MMFKFDYIEPLPIRLQPVDQPQRIRHRLFVSVFQDGVPGRTRARTVRRPHGAQWSAVKCELSASGQTYQWSNVSHY